MNISKNLFTTGLDLSLVCKETLFHLNKNYAMFHLRLQDLFDFPFANFHVFYFLRRNADTVNADNQSKVQNKRIYYLTNSSL